MRAVMTMTDYALFALFVSMMVGLVWGVYALEANYREGQQEELAYQCWLKDNDK